MTTNGAVLELLDLGKDYGERTAVAGIDLAVQRGEIFGLLGPNGAGKTTTISAACGVIPPSRGTVRVGGHDIQNDAAAAKQLIGLVPQDLALYEDLTPQQNLEFFGQLYSLTGTKLAARIESALALAGLTDRRNEIVKTFSGGMKRRLNLAIGILHEPRLLILDEPTVGVDPQSRRHIFDSIRTLRDGGMTVVYTSHYMEEVEELCDRIAIMDAGKVVASGTLAELTAMHGGGDVEIELAGEPAQVEAAAAVVGTAAAAGTAAASAAATATATGTAAGTGTAGADRGGASGAGGGVDPSGAGRALGVTRTGNVLSIASGLPLAPLVSAVEATGARIVRIGSRRAGLETVFLALTGRGLRDGG